MGNKPPPATLLPAQRFLTPSSTLPHCTQYHFKLTPFVFDFWARSLKVQAVKGNQVVEILCSRFTVVHSMWQDGGPYVHFELQLKDGWTLDLSGFKDEKRVNLVDLSRTRDHVYTRFKGEYDRVDEAWEIQVITEPQ